MLDVDFNQILKQGGIPTTKAELDAQWKQDVIDAGSSINNDNAYSPFWRVVTAMITSPALWVIQFLANTVLPNAFVKYATGTFLDLLADGVDLVRKNEVIAQGVITFTRDNVSISTTIPAGTLVQTPSLNGKIYQLRVTEETVFLPGLSTVNAMVEGVEAGAEFNLAAGYYAILPVPIGNISGVTNSETWLKTPGADKESDDDLRSRVRNQFGTASDFHTDAVYRALISEFPGVAIDAIWFEHDAPRGPGTANAFVLFDFSAPVVQYLADINDYITDQGNHGHGDDLIVYQMPEQNYDLAVTVSYKPFLSADEISQLQSDVDTFVSAAFRENTLYSPTQTKPYDQFSFSQLDKELHLEFADLHSVDFDLEDIVSQLWVARLNTLTVNMQEAAIS